MDPVQEAIDALTAALSKLDVAAANMAEVPRPDPRVPYFIERGHCCITEAKRIVVEGVGRAALEAAREVAAA